MAVKQNGSVLAKVITASSVGTMIEWYDFYIFGVLATTLAPNFFPKDNPTAGLLNTLATFATGFLVRPFGAAFFGKLGDVIGRKTTFLVTLLLMGGSTFAIGVLPTYTQIGVFAPLLLLTLRLIQGLALGGEYGGAATYVAEHAPDGRRGFYTSFIQTTATLGMFVSLGVILLVRQNLSSADFDAWGWRIPFLLSLVLVVFSYVIRARMQESPLFSRLKEKGAVSKNPLTESFRNPTNRKLVFLALFGATMGQGVVWYTGQFNALYFLQTELNVDKGAASVIVAIALLIGTPLFIYFGALSDRIGRKPIIIAGMVLAAFAYLPIYAGMASAANVQDLQPVAGQPAVGTKTTVDPKTQETVVTATTITNYDDGSSLKVEVIDRTPVDDENPKPKQETKKTLTPSGGMMVALSLYVLLQVVFVTMVYGPIAAFLVELFPTRVRYTSLSIPYHIGNGVFGGLVPVIVTAVSKGTGNKLMGLAYPISIALITAIVGGILIKEKRDVVLDDTDSAPAEEE